MRLTSTCPGRKVMENLGLSDGFTQERTSAREEYTPPFDLSGV